MPVRLFACLTILLAFCAVANAATYYVDNGGNDNATGLSDTNSWAGITRVNNGPLNNGGNFAAGDVIQFKRGSSWTGTTVLVKTPVFTSESQRVTYGAYGNAGDPRPVISAPGLTCLQVNDHDYITVQDLELRDARNGVDFTRMPFALGPWLELDIAGAGITAVADEEDATALERARFLLKDTQRRHYVISETS
jgi:hypothetical protein